MGKIIEEIGPDLTCGANGSPIRRRDMPASDTSAAEQRWLEESRAALEAWDDYFEVNGIPLVEYRQF